MLYEFKVGNNTVKATKSICCVKIEGGVDGSTVTKWFKKFCLGYKNLIDHARSYSPKTMDSEVMLRARKANLESSTQKISGRVTISQSNVIQHLHKLGKSLYIYIYLYDIYNIYIYMLN